VDLIDGGSPEIIRQLIYEAYDSGWKDGQVDMRDEAASVCGRREGHCQAQYDHPHMPEWTYRADEAWACQDGVCALPIKEAPDV
jgi:hypothetical protein